jgi:hypothetical protein
MGCWSDPARQRSTGRTFKPVKLSIAVIGIFMYAGKAPIYFKPSPLKDFGSQLKIRRDHHRDRRQGKVYSKGMR